MKFFRSICISLSFVSFLFLSVAQSANAQFILVEEFDDVTAPALPTSWSAENLSGINLPAITSTTSPLSAPNSAFLLDFLSQADNALVSPVMNFSAGDPLFDLIVDFSQKRGMADGVSGGVLEISINGAPFVDVTDVSVGGVFTFSGYNNPSLGGDSTLAGRAAWTGTSATYEPVSLTIPGMAAGTDFQLRWRLASSSTPGGPGWFIDSIQVSTAVSLELEFIPSKSEVLAGDEIDFTARFTNPSSVTFSDVNVILLAPAGEEITNIDLPSSAIQDFGDWIKVALLSGPIASFGTAEFDFTVQTLAPTRASAVMTVEAALDPAGVGTAIGLGFVSSSPEFPDGGFPLLPISFSQLDDFCTPPGAGGQVPGIFGSLFLAPAFPTTTCPVGQSALNAQAAGAAAFARYQATPSATLPFPSVYVDEPATPGLNIPALTLDYISTLGASEPISGPVGTTGISLIGKKQPARSTLAVGGYIQPLGGPPLGIGVSTTTVDVILDQDGDGTADDVDGCPSDPDKVSVGICGCGVADTDSDADGTPDCNDQCPSDASKQELGLCGCGVQDTDLDGSGITDCFVNEELKAQLQNSLDLLSSVKFPRGKKKRRKAARAIIKSILEQTSSTEAYINTNAAQLVLIDSVANGEGIAAPQSELEKAEKRLKRLRKRLNGARKAFNRLKRGVRKKLQLLLGQFQ